MSTLSQRELEAVAPTLAEQINNLLPQTQCTKCGYPACQEYALAIADDSANYNQCPPGGQEGINRLANLLGKTSIPLNPANGIEKARTVAFIEEATCIGCTLCIQACPVDAIMGANKQMHTVIPDLCTGCDLCVAPCPVDCIIMLPTSSTSTGWQAWSQEQADSAKLRHQQRELRLIREKQENEKRLLAKAHEKLQLVSSETAETQSELDEKERKKKIIANAILRANSKKELQQ
ncbi:electron transport complex subunit RsxB [Undibacterium flavidum]|uniref:Electron transport complex subunit RsxB n=1 Tax=Undibacterium flavidum TaxID=2762297 RepID=A0ABR6YCY0_9BURK|nr:electron transport complex subunit RsxB [Undibacterium flavidum]MBC3874382.1 electron transport complex subunit RsxB [Undibacterium flavidum]